MSADGIGSSSAVLAVFGVGDGNSAIESGCYAPANTSTPDYRMVCSSVSPQATRSPATACSSAPAATVETDVTFMERAMAQSRHEAQNSDSGPTLRATTFSQLSQAEADMDGRARQAVSFLDGATVIAEELDSMLGTRMRPFRPQTSDSNIIDIDGDESAKVLENESREEEAVVVEEGSNVSCAVATDRENGKNLTISGLPSVEVDEVVVIEDIPPTRHEQWIEHSCTDAWPRGQGENCGAKEGGSDNMATKPSVVRPPHPEAANSELQMKLNRKRLEISGSSASEHCRISKELERRQQCESGSNSLNKVGELDFANPDNGKEFVSSAYHCWDVDGPKNFSLRRSTRSRGPWVESDLESESEREPREVVNARPVPRRLNGTDRIAQETDPDPPKDATMDESDTKDQLRITPLVTSDSIFVRPDSVVAPRPPDLAADGRNISVQLAGVNNHRALSATKWKGLGSSHSKVPPVVLEPLSNFSYRVRIPSSVELNRARRDDRVAPALPRKGRRRYPPRKELLRHSN
jgi:hypothetical protein